MKIEELTSYRLVEKKKIEDLNSMSYLLEHKKSGARLALLSNDDENKVDVMERIAPFFRPEFLNRFNAVIEFNQLSKEDLKIKYFISASVPRPRTAPALPTSWSIPYWKEAGISR